MAMEVLLPIDGGLKLRYGSDRNIMKSPPAVKNQPADRPRGRPRSVEARRAILRATHELLAEGGVSSVTIEGIAARAGVGKPTIYRSWPNAHAVAMAALMEGSPTATATMHAADATTPNRSHATLPVGEAKSQGSALGGLRAQLHDVARVFSAPLGRSVAMMIAAAEQETELSKAFRNHFILARRNEGRAFLARATATREIGGDFDMEVALDLIYAPVFYRLLMGHAPLTGRFIDEVLSLALTGLAAGARSKP
jgi:AcrR family transcriptional regulator